MLRPLRIAVSVVSCICCLLLIVLWVRSFSRTKWFGKQVTSTYSVGALSDWGDVFVGVYNTKNYYDGPLQLFTEDDLRANRTDSPFGQFYFDTGVGSYKVVCPHWFLILLSGLVAAVAGVRRPFKFTTRTLLIAITLVAVVMGAAIWVTA